jgi:hypothetical protein
MPAREPAKSAQPIEPPPSLESWSKSAEGQADDRAFVLQTAGHYSGDSPEEIALTTTTNFRRSV